MFLKYFMETTSTKTGTERNFPDADVFLIIAADKLHSPINGNRMRTFLGSIFIDSIYFTEGGKKSEWIKDRSSKFPLFFDY